MSKIHKNKESSSMTTVIVVPDAEVKTSNEGAKAPDKNRSFKKAVFATKDDLVTAVSYLQSLNTKSYQVAGMVAFAKKKAKNPRQTVDQWREFFKTY